MNPLTVTVILSLAFALTFVSASTITRILPLPPVPGPSGGAGEAPSISVNLTTDFLLTTLGFTGGALSSQQISEGASGSSEVPALLVSSSSNSATAEQGGVIESVALVEVPEEAVSTVNEINTDFLAAGTEEVTAALHGINATFEYAGESAVPLGGGVTLSEATTDVEIINARK